ncbi:2-phosphosulfolactate phosphatase [uncultured Mediterranean phage uvMED]|nr:2-phosphosulfolactate phosphatase [uncultured Mediterranean phage uvMED]BAQ84867.1 2-phosphosulfolactate phosphatase [uncultured Mediterranean phage uvMED]BAQ84905.1 2-phosphosulfolactate phosphatase [uncultured Mediterranean phage uvMED]BAR14871.1 2-phosphosulfolactate phosphatase [uncultured Mediterranean phage uvMED]BAR14885.1 2-phosphosulfolactate phosphatase [uncultured Mediterranean phage uvMED]
MAGSLKKITEVTVGSGVSSFDIGGSEWNDSYDVYMVDFHNVQLTSTSNDARINMRILKSDNSADVTSNYDYAFIGLRSSTSSFDDLVDSNQDKWQNVNYLFRGGTGFGTNGIIYLFNFNNASEYNFLTNETNSFGYDGDELMGTTGGLVHSVAQVSKGLQFLLTTSTYAGGKCVLYGLKN